MVSFAFVRHHGCRTQATWTKNVLPYKNYEYNWYHIFRKKCILSKVSIVGSFLNCSPKTIPPPFPEIVISWGEN